MARWVRYGRWGNARSGPFGMGQVRFCMAGMDWPDGARYGSVRQVRQDKVRSGEVGKVRQARIGMVWIGKARQVRQGLAG